MNDAAVAGEQRFNVRGMSCGHCRAAVEGEVGALAGVTGVQVDLERNTVTVAGTAPTAQIVEAIVEAGYEVIGEVG